MSWPKPMPIVEVEWVDSVRHGGWSSPEQYAKGIGEGKDCRTAGYLFRKDRKSICVALNQGTSDDGSICDMMEIPRSAVRSIRVIEKPKRGKK